MKTSEENNNGTDDSTVITKCENQEELDSKEFENINGRDYSKRGLKYSCNKCSKSYISLCALNHHLKSHEKWETNPATAGKFSFTKGGSVKCSKCGGVYTLGHLYLHLLACDKEKKRQTPKEAK